MTALQLMVACCRDDEIAGMTGRLVLTGADVKLLSELINAICGKAEVLSDAERPRPTGFLA